MQKLNITGLTRRQVTGARLAGLRPDTGWVRQAWLLPLMVLLWGVLSVVAGGLGLSDWLWGLGGLTTMVVLTSLFVSRLNFERVVRRVRTVVVLREGLPRVVAVHDVVLGDVVLTQRGDRLPFVVTDVAGTTRAIGRHLDGGNVLVVQSAPVRQLLPVNAALQLLLIGFGWVIGLFRRTVVVPMITIKRWVAESVRSGMVAISDWGRLLVQRLNGRMILFRRESAFRYNQGPVQPVWTAS